MLDSLVMQAADPGFVETVGISRREAVRSALATLGRRRAEAARGAAREV